MMSVRYCVRTKLLQGQPTTKWTTEACGSSVSIRYTLKLLLQ